MSPAVRLLCALLVVATTALTSGCATNPVTGGKDFVLMSESQELALGRQSAQQVLKEYRPYDDPALQRYVDEVGQRLARTSHRPQLAYSFTVVDSKEVNAFALPGGHIYITRGLLAFLNSEAELAGVLGHEIGHVTARHSVRQYSMQQAAGITQVIGSIFIPELATQAGSQLVGMFGTALLRGYGRDQELEADRLGAEYLARTGYDPTALLGVLTTLKNQEVIERQRASREGREPRVYHGVFSTHPSGDQRLQEVVGLASALRGGGPARVEQERFLKAVEGLTWGDSEHEGVLRGRDFYHGELDFGLRFPEGWQVRNLPDRVVATAPQGAAVLQLGAEKIPGRLAPRDFLTQRMGLRNLAAEGPLDPGGLQGWSAVAPVQTQGGRVPVRFSVIYHGDRAYVLAGLVRDQANGRRWDARFLETAQSFHRLSDEERAQTRALKLHLVRAEAGTRFAGLARQTPDLPDAELLLRLLNGRYPEGEPQPGEYVKTVR